MEPIQANPAAWAYRMYNTHTIRIPAALAAALLLSVTALTITALSGTALADAPDEQYDLAARYYAQGRWPEAVDAFQKMVDSFSDHPRADVARFYLGEAMIQTGQFAAAQKMFDQFRQDKPEHEFAPQALFRSGESAYLANNFEEAQRLLGKFLEQYPDDEISQYALPYLGELALSGGNPAQAEKHYRQCLNKFPRSALGDVCRFGLGRALETQGQHAVAEQYYTYLIEKENSAFVDNALLQQGLLDYRRDQFDDSIRRLQDLVARFPDSLERPRAHYWLGMALSARGDWDAAIEVLEVATKQNAETELAPASHFALAEALRNQDKIETASGHYWKVIQQWPESNWGDDSIDVLMQVAFRAGDFGTVDTLANEFEKKFAESSLRSSIEILHARSLLKRSEYSRAADVLKPLVLREKDLPKGDQTNADYLLALAHIGLEQYDEALQTLGRVEASPDNVEFAAGVEVARATVLFSLAKYEEAIVAQRKYLLLQPDGPDAAKCRAELAVALAHQEKFDEALAVRETLVEKHDDPQILLPTTHFLAEAAYAAQRREVAEQLFRELARDGNPDEFIEKGLYGLAWIQSEAGQRDESAETFKRLVARFPESSHAAEAAYMRAQSLEQAGRKLPALTTYQTVVDSFPNSKYVVDSLLAAARLHARYDDPEHKTESIRLFQRFLDDYPDHEQRAGALYEMAWVHYEAQQTELADAAFTKIHEQFPDSQYWGDVTYRLAEQAARDKDHERARHLTDDLIAAQVSGEILCHGLYLRGQLAADGNDWKSVSQFMGRIVQEYPESTLQLPASYWAAEASFRQRQWEQAQNEFEQLARRVADRDEAWMAMIPLRRAQMLVRGKKWEEALEVAAPVAERFPNFQQQFEVDYIIGRAQASLGRFDSARSSYQRVIQSPTGSRTEVAAMSQWMIGESYFHQHKFDAAIKSYHRVETLYDVPRWQAAALLQAGKCYERKADWESAIKLYAELLRNYAKTPFSDDASKRLRLAQEKLGDGSQR